MTPRLFVLVFLLVVIVLLGLLAFACLVARHFERKAEEKEALRYATCNKCAFKDHKGKAWARGACETCGAVVENLRNNQNGK